MAKYNISKQATEDLYRIWEYTVDSWSEEQADKYYSVLEGAFNRIASHPLVIGRKCDVILPGLRVYHVRRHMVFYMLQPDGRVLIVRVLHEKMDDSQHLPRP